MKYKLLFSFFIVIILGIVGVFSFNAYQKHQYVKLENKTKTKIDEEMKREIGKSHYQQEIDHIQEASVVTYVPVLNNDAENKNLRRLLKKATEKTLQKLSDKSVLIFNTFTEKKSTKKIYSYHFYQQIYKKKIPRLVPEEKRKITLSTSSVFDRQTGKMLNLKDILRDDPITMTALRQAMQNSVIASKKISMQDIEKLSEIHYPTALKNINFTLTNKDLMLPVHVPHVPSISEVNIPLKQLASYFYPKYLPESITIPKKKPLSLDKKIALTFDDGPHKKWTLKVLEILKKYDAKATFFVLGSSALKNPGLVEKELQAGHQVGNHSFDHPPLTKLSKKEVTAQILKTQMVVYNQTGYFPKVVRPPYGAIRKDIAAFINRPIIQWSIDTLDWEMKKASKITENIVKKAYDGAIILMHDTHSISVQSLEATLKKLKEKGYQFVTIDELFQNKEKFMYQYFDQQNIRKVK